jgi:hypothetical protein
MAGDFDEISRAVGVIENAVAELKDRASEDREVGDRRHQQNQDAINELKQTGAGTKSALDHLASETKGAIDRLTSEMKRQVTVTPPAPLPQVQASRGRLYALASVGLVTLWIVGRAIESGVGWAVEKLLKMKFGG